MAPGVRRINCNASPGDQVVMTFTTPLRGPDGNTYEGLLAQIVVETYNPDLDDLYAAHIKESYGVDQLTLDIRSFEGWLQAAVKDPVHALVRAQFRVNLSAEVGW